MAKDRFRHIEIRIGILVLVVVLGTVISLVYVGYKKDLFAKRFTLTILSPTGDKLTKGMPVKLEGFRMGEVTQLDLNDEGQIVLTVKILTRYHKWIRTDSKVYFNQESFIGEPFLRFTSGSHDKPMMQEDAVLTLEFEGGIDEIIRRAKPVMDDLKTIVENLRDFSGELKVTGRQLNEGSGLVPYVLNSSEGTEKVVKILDDLGGLEKNYDELASNLNTIALKLDGTVNRLDTALDNIDSVVTTKVDTILEDVAKTTKDLYLLRRQGEYTLRLGSDLLLQMNNTWPLAPSGEEKKRPELPVP